MPHFCRHGRIAHKCPICTGRRSEPVVGARALTPDELRAQRERTSLSNHKQGSAQQRQRSGQLAKQRGVRVRSAARIADDGFRCQLVSGIKLSDDARRLAAELAFSTGRLAAWATDPPTFYAELARLDDREEALWRCFLAAYLSPLEASEPFQQIIAAAVNSWASGAIPDLSTTQLGPRSTHDQNSGDATLVAYKAFAERAGSQFAALQGESYWTPERRFERTFERLALPGLTRAARYEFLVTIGGLGLVDNAPALLNLKLEDEVAVAAKRVFGIGDAFLLERRAQALAAACEIPLGALDLALFNWGREPSGRVHLGFSNTVPDETVSERVLAVFEL